MQLFSLFLTMQIPARGVGLGGGEEGSPESSEQGFSRIIVTGGLAARICARELAQDSNCTRELKQEKLPTNNCIRESA